MTSLFRLYVIYRTLLRYGLDELTADTPVATGLKILLYLTPAYWFRKPDSRPIGERIRLSLEALGPIFIKFGQVLSTRRDLLPPDIANELAKLQDNAPPFSGEQAQAMLEASYGKSLSEVFVEFDVTPLAAASVAQVHTARLHNGREVVVKIIRPDVELRIRRDLNVLYLFAKLVEGLWEEGRRLHPTEVVKEFDDVLHDELDMLREAGNCSLLRRNFENSRLLYVPEVEWDYTTPQAIVMERVRGIPIGDIEALKAHGVNFQRLSEIGVEIFFTQVFRDNFFHADMHPGNIFVDVTNPDEPGYIALDFGIMGTLNPDELNYLAQNFLAFFNRDYRRVAELMIDSGWTAENTRLEAFEGAIRSVCEPIFNRPLKDISFGLFLLRLFQTARRFEIEIQPQLVLLQKTLLNVEGLGRQLYPDLDLWDTAQPFLENWMEERLSPTAIMTELRRNAPQLLGQLPRLPGLAHDVLDNVRDHQRNQQQTAQSLIAIQRELRAIRHSQFTAAAGGALLISGSLILALETLYVFNMPALGVMLGSVGTLLLVSLWLKS